MRFIIALGLFLGLTAPIQAQQVKVDSAGHAYIYASATRNGSISKAAYVQAIRTCDRKVLQVSCDELIIAATSFIPGGHKYESLNELADYFDSLVDQDCRVSPVVMSRIRFGKAERWPRATRSGEKCLYDNNLALDIASLSCGNLIVDANVPQRVVVQVESPEPVAAPAPVATAPTVAAAQVGVTPPPQPKPEAKPAETKKEPAYRPSHKGRYIVGAIATGIIAGFVIDNNPQWYRRGKDVVNVGVIVNVP